MSSRTNPFPGLRPFRSDEHHLFFGREEQTAELLALLRQHRFLAVVGTSGSGKSSLVQAGLIPALHRGTMTRAGSTWEVIVLRPGGQPIENLARALVEADLYDAEDPDTLPRLGATLKRSRFGLVEAIRQSEDVDPDTNLLVVVDQFEELFRFRQSGVESEEAAAAFVNLLFAASEQEEQRIYIALTMRSDYLGDCSEIPELAEAVNRGEYLIPRLLRDQKREAIEMPVGVGGAKISRRLVQRMLNEIGDDPDQLPVLQHALMRTWEVWSQRDNGGAEIDFADFEATGGLAEALSRHADEIYHALPDDAHRQTCKRLYQALTVKGSDNRGIRRPTRLADLEAIAGADRSMVTAILDAYRRPGVTFLMPGVDFELTGETVVDLSHESLMRCWRRLDHWVEDESQSARIYRRVRETAALHAEGQAGLYHDPDLQIAQSWREDSRPNLAWADQYGQQFEPTMAFLDQSEESARASEREQEAARTRELERAKESAAQASELADAQRSAASNFRRFALGMGVVALLALGAFGIALQKGKEAEQARVVADQLKISAEENEKQTNREFALSDATIGHSFLSPGVGERGLVVEDVGRGVAHLARSLQRAPNQPTITDRIFNVFAHQAPPLYRMPEAAHGEARGAPRRPLVASVATADASVVAWTTRYRSVSIWNSKSPGDIREWEDGTKVASHGLDLDRNGKHLLIGEWPAGDAQLIDLDAWKRLRLENRRLNDLRGRVPRFSTRGDRYMIRTMDYGIQLCDAKTGTFVKHLGSLGKSPIDPVLSPTERHLALIGEQVGSSTFASISVTAVADNSDGEAGLPAVKLIAPSPMHIFSGIAFSPDGTHLQATANSEEKASILVWRIDAPDPEFSVSHEPVPSGLSGIRGSNPKSYYSEGGYGRDGTTLAAGDPDLDDCYIVGAFTPDGQRLLTAGTDQTVRLWSAASGVDQASRLQDSVAIQDQIAWNCEPLFSRDGQRLMIRTRDYGCLLGSFGKNRNELPPLVRGNSLVDGYVFLADSGVIKPLLLACDRVTSGSLHPHDSIIALGTADGRVSILDLSTGERLAASAGDHGVVVDLAFNRDGSRLAARSDSGSLRDWDTSKVRDEISLIAVEDVGIGPADRAAGFAVGEHVLAVSSDASWILNRDGQLLPVPTGDKNGGRSGVLLQSAWADPVETARFSADARIVATASADENFLQVFSTDTGETVTPPLSHGIKHIKSLGFSPDGKMLAAGSQSGAVRLWRLPTGESADHLEIKGTFSCADVVFGPRGRLLATVFEGGSESYVQIWDAGTGQAISERLSNGSRLSRAAFIEGGTRLVAWPQKHAAGGSLEEQQAGWASVWDVSVSAGEAPPPWFSEVATSFGGIRLDGQSAIERIEKRNAPAKIAGGSPADARLARFFEWLTLIPGTRPDSPFREDPSDLYVESLIDQTSFEFLDEAIRLRPDHARALARRGVLRLPASNEVDPGTRVLSTVDVTRARLLAPDDTELAWYEGIAMEVSGHGEDAEAAYAAARKLPPMELEALGRVIEIQELYAAHLGESGQRELLDQALIAAQADESIDELLATRWLVRRFLLAAESVRFAEAEIDWQVIKELESVDEDWSRQLLATYLEVATAGAEQLMDDGKPDAAVRLLEPVALLAELNRVVDLPEDPAGYTPTAALALLGEWKNVGGADVEFIAAGSEWAYFDDGIDQGTDWRELEFDDSDWDRGKAKLGYGNRLTEAPIATRLDYGDDEDAKYPTTYFRKEFFVADGDQREFVKIDVVRDDGVIIYLNGGPLWRDNMPTGKVDYGDFALATNGGVEGAHHRATRSGRGLRAGRNVIAAEVHQINGQSSDIAFELRLEGADSSPWAHLDQRLRGAEGGRLQEAATGLLPRRLRERWQAALMAAFSDQTEAPPKHREEVALAAYSLQDAWHHWDGALATAQAAVEQLTPAEGKSTPFQSRRRKDWLGRVEDQLVRLLRPEDEIEAVRSELFSAPPRDPALGSKLIELGPHYTASLYDKRAWTGGGKNYVLNRLAETFIPLHGVDFDLRGIVQLNSGVFPANTQGISEMDLSERAERSYPEAVPEIVIDQKSKAIHFLMSCTYGHEEPNVEVARLVIHFDDGTEPQVMPIRYAEHIVDWGRPRTLADPAVIGWHGTLANGVQVALSEIVWRNPHPDKTISHVDFISNLKLAAPFFLVGITLE